MNLPRSFREIPVVVAVVLAIVIASSTVIFASPSVSVPEPLSVSLLGVGIAGLAGKKWIDHRRKK